MRYEICTGEGRMRGVGKGAGFERLFEVIAIVLCFTHR